MNAYKIETFLAARRRFPALFRAIAAIALVVLAFSCSEDPGNRPGMYDSQVKSTLVPGNKLVHANKKTNLIISIVDSSLSVKDVEWKCNFGTINIEGEKTVYLAPDTVGTAFIEACITCSNMKTSKAVAEVNLYRQLVLLKADDMVFDGKTTVSDNWRAFNNYVISKKLKAGLGLMVWTPINRTFL